MKCELPGSRYQNSIKIYERGQLPDSTRTDVEALRFGIDKFKSPEARERELYYDRLYQSRSIYVIYYSPVNPSCIVAVARIIEKRSLEDKLPVEYATVQKTIVHSELSERHATAGQLFSVECYDPRLPVCEIGGLHAADVDLSNGISAKIRYRAIDEVMKECDKQVHDRGYASFFLTCIGSPNMERLYHDKFFFNEVAHISWGGSPSWRALWRIPFANPKKEINYAQKKS